MAYQLYSFQGKIRPMSDAVVPLSKIEYAYGFGVYENVRVVRGRPLFLSDHIDRLFHSARIIGLAHTLDAKKVEGWTEALIKEVGDDAFNLKMLLIGGRTAEDAELSILPLAPKFPDKKLYKTGATAILYPYERLFPQAKTLNMLGSYLAHREATNAGAYDALLVNRRGEIVEGTRTNFFLVEGTNLISAPREEILEGVTMKHVLHVAASQGLYVVHEPISEERMRKADGAFLTSTSSKIMPLSKIGDHTLQVPEVVRTLMNGFASFVQEHEE